MISEKVRNQDSNPSLLKITKILSVTVIALGMLVVGGWIFDIDVIKAPFNRIQMPFVAAISFVLIGISLYLLSRFYEGKQSVGIVVIPICLLVVFIFMATSFVSLFLNVHAGIETAIENAILKKEDANETIPSARPPVPASIVFILVASAQTSVIAGYSRSNKLLKIFGTIVMAIASSAVIGHILNQPILFYSLSWSNGIPSHGAIGMEIMGISLVLLGRLDYKRNIRIETTTIKTRLIFLFTGFMAMTLLIFSLWSYYIATTPRSLQDVTHIIVIMTSVILSTVTAYALIISRSISSGITNLRSVSEEFRKGRFDVKADENSNDEMGQLGRSFNGMVESIRLNEELRTKELRTEAEKLREINKEKEEFAAMISHELKTPLVPIQGYAELLMRGRLGDMAEIQKESVRTIYDNAIRLSRLIQDMLDVRKMDLGRLKLDIRDTSTKEIINGCLEAFKTMADTKKISLVNGSQDVPIKCDPERILQVLNNIVNNAMKFVYSGKGRIEINTVMTDGAVTFSVKDNGIGIPKEKQAELFRKFYQVDTSLGRKAGGSGLGLAISKGIIESHGGKIWIESEEGKGTTVYFSLPKEVSV